MRDLRRSAGYAALNRPLTILGVERRGFLLVATLGLAMWNATASLVTGGVVFAVGFGAGWLAGRKDPDMLGVLRAEDIRHRRIASDEVLLRRLLSLDYVLEHTGLSWLPTESEKVGAFQALGIERELLPSRLYRGHAGNTRRYFPVKLPVALEAERAVFVCVDPGHDTSTALRSWGVAHRGLWEALGERGRSIEVVAVVRTVRELQRAQTILENWTNTSTASGPSAVPEPDSAARREIVRIEQAIRKKDDRVLKEYGDLQACLKRIIELNDLHRSSSPGTMIHGFATWRSRRLPGGGF